MRKSENKIKQNRKAKTNASNVKLFEENNNLKKQKKAYIEIGTGELRGSR